MAVLQNCFSFSPYVCVSGTAVMNKMAVNMAWGKLQETVLPLLSSEFYCYHLKQGKPRYKVGMELIYYLEWASNLLGMLICWGFFWSPNTLAPCILLYHLSSKWMGSSAMCPSVCLQLVPEAWGLVCIFQLQVIVGEKHSARVSQFRTKLALQRGLQTKYLL